MPKKSKYIFFVCLISALTVFGFSGCANTKEVKKYDGPAPAGSIDAAKKAKYDIKKTNFVSALELGEDKWALDNYFIDIGDVLEISVWQIQNLQRQVVVRPDGKISFPLIGDVPAVGRTIEELRQDIVEKIKVYIKVPQVSVSMLEFGGKKAIVLGEVRSEGVIRFASLIRVTEAVALAGGFDTTANMDRIFVIRNLYTDEQPTVIVINANNILKKGILKENVLIYSGDIIYIPRAFIADFKVFMDNTIGPLLGYAESYYGDTWKRREAGAWKYKSQWKGLWKPGEGLTNSN